MELTQANRYPFPGNIGPSFVHAMEIKPEMLPVQEDTEENEVDVNTILDGHKAFPNEPLLEVMNEVVRFVCNLSHFLNITFVCKIISIHITMCWLVYHLFTHVGVLLPSIYVTALLYKFNLVFHCLVATVTHIRYSSLISVFSSFKFTHTYGTKAYNYDIKFSKPVVLLF